MQKIENLTADDKLVLKTPLESINPRSVNNVKDLRQIDKICDAIDSAGDTLELEDADYAFLKKRFQDYDTWNPEPQIRRLVLATGDKLK